MSYKYKNFFECGIGIQKSIEFHLNTMKLHKCHYTTIGIKKPIKIVLYQGPTSKWAKANALPKILYVKTLSYT